MWKMPSSGLEPPRLSAQALNLLRIPFRHEGKSNLIRLRMQFYPNLDDLSIPIFSRFCVLTRRHLAILTCNAHYYKICLLMQRLSLSIFRGKVKQGTWRTKARTQTKDSGFNALLPAV